MYLTLLLLPLLGSIFSGLLGRKLGITGSHFITIFCLILTSILTTFAFYEVALCSNPVTIYLTSWIDSELLNISWEFMFDQLTVSMLLPVLYISTVVHIFSVSYMKGDPHKCLGKAQIEDKLSNSGDTLKNIVPSHSRKVMSGWSNYSCTVTSYIMMETEMGNRGSKSSI